MITPESLANFSETPKTFTLVNTSGGISGLDAGEIVIDDTAFPGTGSWSVQVAGNLLQLSYSLGTALDAWTTAQPGVPAENPVTFQEVNNFYGAGIDQVTVKIPRALAAPGTKLFARLKVEIP